MQIKENIKVPRHLHIAGNLPVTGEFPAQMASNAENVSIWWRHHDTGILSLQKMKQVNSIWSPQS